jgi:hypothetical protein
MWTLCLELHHTPLNGAESAAATTPGPIRGATAALQPIAPRPAARVVLSVATPEATSLAQLHTLAATAVGLDSIITTTESSSSDEPLSPELQLPLQLVVGFPRRPQTLPADSRQSLTESGLVHNQDRIQVIVHSAASSSAAVDGAADSASSNSKDAESNGRGGRPRRQAAANAAVRIAAEIQAQEPRPIIPRLKNSSGSTVPSSPQIKKANTNTKSGTAAVAAGSKAQVSRHFAALSRRTTAAASSSTSSPASAAGGRRLRDGASISPPPPPRAQRRKVNPTDAVPNDTDSVAEGLLALATSGGGNGNNTAGQRLMRRGWRQAVQSAHEQTLSTCRVAASAQLNAVSFRIIPAAPNSDAEAASSIDSLSQEERPQLSVAFPKGVQGRGQYTDVVDYLDRNVLVAAIAAIYPAEALRASNLALLSPRVYWSLLYHYVSESPLQPAAPTSMFKNVVHDALQWSNPQLDWSYLRRRPVQLSAKARENLRQQSEANAAASTTTDDWEAAARAISDVEQAMHDMPTFLLSRSDERHRANTSAGTVGTTASTWFVVTPSEEDRDEIKDCILSFSTEQQHGMDSSSNQCYKLDVVVAILCDSLQLHNWRELANLNDEATLSKQMLAALESKTSDTPPGSDNNDNGTVKDRPRNLGEENATMVSISVEAVKAWIEYAQQQSVEEIIVEICDGQAEAVDLLHQAARSGTPRDLAAWQSIARLLYQCLVDYVAASSGATEQNVPNVATLQLWCDRAQQALNQLDWLGDYVTTIDPVDPLEE